MTQVARFDSASNQYASAAHSATLASPSTALTIAGWYYRHGDGDAWHGIVGKSRAGTYPFSAYAFYRYSSNSPPRYVGLAADSSTAVEAGGGGSGYQIPSGGWYFFAFTWSSGTATVRWWDSSGTLLDTTTVSASPPTTIDYGNNSDVNIGGGLNEDSNTSLACMGIHNAVVSDADLTTWRTTGEPPITLSGAFWPLNGVWTDSAQGNTLTAQNSATFVDVTVPWSGGGTAATVVAVAAEATGEAPAPVVTAAATIAAPSAEATGEAPAPAVSAGDTVPATVAAPAAEADSEAPSPWIQAATSLSMGAAEATGDAPTPTVSAAGTATVSAPSAEATGAAPAPVVEAEVFLEMGSAEATGDAPAPVVEALGAGEVRPNAPAAEATGDAPTPVVVAQAVAVVAAPSAEATAAAPAPVIFSVRPGVTPVPLPTYKVARRTRRAVRTAGPVFGIRRRRR